MLTTWNFQINHEPLEKVEKSLDAIKERLDFLAAGEVAKGLFEMVEKFGQMAEQLHLASASAGLTVEEMQRLSFSAQQAGVSAESVSTGMFRLSRALYSARQGNEEALKSFSKLGISSDQLTQFKTAKDALGAISDRMHTIKDPIEKAALSMALLGRGSRDMVGWLSQGSASIKATGDKAYVLSEDQVEALVSAEHTMGAFWNMIKNIAGSIAANFAPVLERAVHTVMDFVAANKQLIENNVENWLKGLAFMFGFIVGVIESAVYWFLKLAHALGFEDHILQAIGLFAGLVTGILAFKTAAMVLSPVISAVSSAFGILQKAVGAIKWIWGFFEGLAAVIGVSTGALIGIIAAVGALVVIGHDLWQVFHNGKSFKDTWIGQGAKYIQDLIEKFTGLKQIFGMGDSDKKSAEENTPGAGVLKGISQTQAFGNSLMPNLTGNPAYGSAALTPDFGFGVTPATSQNQINAPVTINVPPNTPPEQVGKHVQMGIKDHLDSVMRETKRSLTPAVAH